MQRLLGAAVNILRRTRARRSGGASDPSSAQDLLESGFHLHRSGRWVEALPLYQRALEADPASDIAQNLLGCLFCSLGRLADGESCFRKALEVNSSNAQAWNNLANVRKDQGDLAEAEQCYLRTLGIDPRFSAASTNLGLLYLQFGRLGEAETCFRRVLDVDPLSAEARSNLGTVLRLQGKVLEAEVAFRAAIYTDPALAEAWCGLGDVLHMRRHFDEAEACCTKALKIRPAYADALSNRGTIARARGRLDDAQAYCDEALRIEPRHVGALNNLGGIAVRRNDYLSAQSFYRKALAIDPHGAITRYNLSTTLLTLGNYAEGFDLYESRFAAFNQPLAKSPVLNEKLTSKAYWRGETLGAKRLLVWTEQGFGDCIMMLRFLPELAKRGVETVTVFCDSALGTIVGSMAGVDDVVTTYEQAEAVDFDIHVPMMSLPRAFGTRVETIPAETRYISVSEPLISACRDRLSGSRPMVGLAWAGSRTLQEDARRSISLVQFGPLFELDHIEFVSLQKGDAAAEWANIGRSGGDYINQCVDFLDTAALIMNLDLVITVDTAVAHLAGALGRPVWLLNRFGSEWRWGMEGDRTPWYGTMTIFRQREPASWLATIESIAARLAYEY